MASCTRTGMNVRVQMSPPATGGTEGTVINHVGFLVPNVQEAFAKWKAAGLPIEMGKDRTDQAWVRTADGLKVEILEDKGQGRGAAPAWRISGFRPGGGQGKTAARFRLVSARRGL